MMDRERTVELATKVITKMTVGRSYEDMPTCKAIAEAVLDAIDFDSLASAQEREGRYREALMRAVDELMADHKPDVQAVCSGCAAMGWLVPVLSDQPKDSEASGG